MVSDGSDLISTYYQYNAVKSRTEARVTYPRTRTRQRYRPEADRLVDQMAGVVRFHHCTGRTDQADVDRAVRLLELHRAGYP